MTEPAELTADLQHEEASGLAQRRGWRHRSHDHDLVERWPGAPFAHGSFPKVHNVIEAQVDGREVIAFDYRFCVFHDDDADASDRYVLHRYLVVVIPLATQVPPLSASEGYYGYWRPAGEPLPVEHERFGEHYNLVGTDPAFASAVLDREWMDRVLHRMRRTEWRFTDDVLVAWARDQRTGQHLEQLIELLVPLATAAERAAQGG